MRKLLAFTAASLLGASALLAGVAPTGCDNSGGGTSTAGGEVCGATFRCATPSCADSPMTPGCDDVPPEAGRCPLLRSRCFDPKKSPSYCEPMGHRCAAPRDPLPAGCDLTGACSIVEVKRCMIVDEAQLVCHAGQRCVTTLCEDGGAADM